MILQNSYLIQRYSWGHYVWFYSGYFILSRIQYKDSSCFPFEISRFFFFFLLYNIVLVLTYINMHLPWVYMYSPSWTSLPHPSPYHPSGSSQCTSPKLHVSCIEPGLAIRFLYDVIYVLMPFSQIIPLPSHRVQNTVLYICVSFTVSPCLTQWN